MNRNFKIWNKQGAYWEDRSAFVITGDGYLMAIDVGTRKLVDVDESRYEIVWSTSLQDKNSELLENNSSEEQAE